jgi:Protein of unknown function
MAEYDDEPEICSTLRWSDVELPPSITEGDLDRLIFSLLKSDWWRKTARIIGDAAEHYEARSIPIKYDIIAARLQALAEAGQIDSKGNLSMWRHSEVRLKSS